MAHVEGQVARIIKPITWVGNRLSRRGGEIQHSPTPDWKVGPLLTAQARDRLIAEDKRMLQSIKRLEEKLAIEPKPQIPEYIEFHGKKMKPVEAFLAKCLELKQMRLEALARGEKYVPPPLPLRPIDLKPPTPERKKQNDEKLVRFMDYQIAKEATNAQFDRRAEIIQRVVWHKATAQIEPYHRIKIAVKDDGTTINRSQSGTRISTGKDALIFGIGYFGEREHIVEEAQGLVTDEELQEGAKGYFIRHNYTVEEDGKQVEKAEMIVIPLAYQHHTELFHSLLLSAAVVLSPDEETADINKRRGFDTKKAPILTRAGSIAA